MGGGGELQFVGPLPSPSFFFSDLITIFFLTMTTTTTQNQQRVSDQEKDGKWPQSSSERAACWDFVLSLREQFGLDEAGAIARAVEVLVGAGREVTAGVIARCKPRRKGPDTHVQDVGRAVLERGLGETVSDGREAMLLLSSEEEELEAEELEAKRRVEIGTAAIGALFRKVIPSLPAAEWTRKLRTLYLRPGAEIVCVSGRGLRVEAWPAFVVGDAGEGWFVRNEINEVVPVVKGAIGVVESGRLVRTLLNATVKAVRGRGSRVEGPGPGAGGLTYFQWMPGAGDWQVHFKTFVTYASMFCPASTNHTRGAALAELLGECRASISARKRKIFALYKSETGGHAGFEGMRATVDPRKGKKTGPRKKPVDASLN